MQEEIRATPANRLPDVDRFIEVHAKGELRDPAEAAREIWALLERGLPNGAVYDLRNQELT